MKRPLTDRQLEIVCHLANGHRMEDIMQLSHLSKTAVNDALRRGKENMDARTNAHLVSLCIASDQLQWNPKDEVRYIDENGENQ